ncbi:MAG: pro-sigmaK processing inhibitor BofA family protein [Oscillospiraceae bacterium]|nr:pro-sigmaK processing inhibitor BofA family protein [Oscillospiraceae bacterium]
MAALTGAVLFLAAVVIRVFSAPFKVVGRVLLNTLLGFALLCGVNAASAVTGLSLGVNLYTALTVGILGVPGLGLLLLLQWVF